MLEAHAMDDAPWWEWDDDALDACDDRWQLRDECFTAEMAEEYAQEIREADGLD